MARIPMTNKLEAISLFFGAGASLLAAEALEKIIITSIAMIIGTTIAHYWKKYLEDKNKKK